MYCGANVICNYSVCRPEGHELYIIYTARWVRVYFVNILLAGEAIRGIVDTKRAAGRV
jgi:hypothetical protein